MLPVLQTKLVTMETELFLSPAHLPEMVYLWTVTMLISVSLFFGRNLKGIFLLLVFYVCCMLAGSRAFGTIFKIVFKYFIIIIIFLPGRRLRRAVAMDYI